MYLKTEKPLLTASDSENIKLLLAYTENLKDEIEFRLDTLSQKYEKILEIIIKIQGEE